MKPFLLLILLCSCGYQKTTTVGVTEMPPSKFELIDAKLDSLALKLNAKIGKDAELFPPSAFGGQKIEARRILWTTGEISKGIIIRPVFYAKDSSSAKWDIIILAWLENVSLPNHERPSWIKYLMTSVDFEFIRRNIDHLIETSTRDLEKVRIEDFK